MSKIDPHCLRGVDHLHHAKHFSSLGDLMNYLKGSILPEHLDGKAWRQVIHKYKGYTGEEVAIDHLRDAGHHVEQATSGTEPGHDVLVDGQLHNVKVTHSPAYIRHHLHDHPDIDVVTNSEMASAFQGDPHVHIDHALSAQDAFHTTAGSFEGIHDMGGLFHHIRVITMILSGARNARGVLAGRKTGADAVVHTAIDTASIGVGSLGGAQIGLLVGLALAPVTGGLSALAATAGCTLLGSIGGVITGRSIGSWFKSAHLRELRQLLEKNATVLRGAFLRCARDVVESLKRSKEVQIKSFRNSQKQLQSWFQRTFTPTTMVTFYSLACEQSNDGFREWRAFYDSIRNEVMTKTTETEAGLCVYSYGRDVYLASSEITSAWDSVHDCLGLVEKERLRIS